MSEDTNSEFLEIYPDAIEPAKVVEIEPGANPTEDETPPALITSDEEQKPGAIPEIIKGKRGRKPGQVDKVKRKKKGVPAEVKPPEVEGEAPEITEAELTAQISAGFDASQYEEVKIEAKQEQEYKALISGYVLLMGLNLVFPALLLKITKRFYPAAKNILLKDVQLDESELKILERAADEVATMIFTKLSPVSQLLVGFTVMSASKLMFAINTQDK